MIETFRRGIAAFRIAFHASGATAPATARCTSLPLAVDARDSLQTRVRVGQRTICLAGRVWITQDGNSNDMVLGPGQVHQFDRAGGVMIRALERAQVAMDV